MADGARPTNLTSAGRRQRYGIALAMLLVLAAGIVLLARGALPHALRFLLLAPVFVGALGWFQARGGT